DLLVGELVEVGQQKLLDGLADLGDGLQRLWGRFVKRRDGCGQSGDGRRLEEEAQGEIEFKAFEEAGEDLSGEQGMAAEGEEVIVDADLRDGEDFCEDGGDGFLLLAARLDIFFF